MLGWLYLVSVLLAVAGIVYLDRGSIGRGRADVGEADGVRSDVNRWDDDASGESESARSAGTRTRVSVSG